MKKFLSATALVITLAVAGAAYAHDDLHDKDGKDHKSFFEDALPKDKAPQFYEIMDKAREKNKVLIEQMHKLHEERNAVLTVPKFDKDAYIAKSDELEKFRDTMHAKMRANMKEAFADAIATLSQEQRKALADSMEKMHEEHEHNWHHGHHDSDKGGEDKASSDTLKE